MSELWSCQVLAEAPFNLTNGQGATPGLIALAACVRPIFRDPRATPAAAGEVDQLEGEALLQRSNGLFHVLKRFVFAQVAQHHPRGRGQGSQEEFAAAAVAYAGGMALSALAPNLTA